MPSFLSSIPGISSLPNPLSIFTQDDSDSPQPGPSTPRSNSMAVLPSTPQTTPGATSSLTVDTTPGPVSRLSSMFSRGLDVLSSPAGHPSSDPTAAAATPRSALANGNSSHLHKSPSNVVIADATNGSGSGSGSGGSGSPSRSTSPRSDQDKAHGRSRGMSAATAATGATSTSADIRNRRRRVQTFVLVKPPPTSAKNPLNLQVQLVVPARGRPRRGSDPTRIGVDGRVSNPTTPPKPALSDPTDVKLLTSSESSPETSAAGSPNQKSAQLPADSDAVIADKEAKLARRASIGSNRSVESTSATSSSSSATGKQRIIPLYNLAVHNVVQPTTVTDAGTDSKVAKFLKRSLDISGVGVLEPTEVWLPLVNPAESSPRPSIEGSTNSSRRPVSMVSNMSLLSPAPSRLEESKRSSLDSRPSTVASGEAEEGSKKFFGKIFKKRSSADPIVERRGLGRIISSKSSHFLAAEAAPSTSQPHLQVPAASAPGSPVVHFTPSDKEVLAYPTFGLAPAVLKRRFSQAQLNSNGAIVGLVSEIPTSLEEEDISLARSARPIGYTWTVRKWAKKNTEGWAAHIVAAAAAGLDLVAGSLPGDGADEVVFEWVKMRVTPHNEGAVVALGRHPASESMDSAAKARLSRPTKLVKKATPIASREASPLGSRTSLPLRPRRNTRTAALDSPQTLAVDAPTTRRPSDVPRPAPQRRTSETMSRSYEASLDSRHTEDDRRTTASAEDKLCAAIEAGYDSDPEDSETPWSCSVWVKRTGQRQLLATLTPAPHHPKVVGVLKIPTGIKSLTLADLPSTSPELAARVRDEVCLTEENIKDVVNVTAMWLVAREEFSGFGRKEKRKA